MPKTKLFSLNITDHRSCFSRMVPIVFFLVKDGTNSSNRSIKTTCTLLLHNRFDTTN